MSFRTLDQTEEEILAEILERLRRLEQQGLPHASAIITEIPEVEIPPGHTHDGTGENSTVTGGLNEDNPGKAIASGDQSIAYGDYAQATDTEAIAIGGASSDVRGVQAINTSTIAIGSFDDASGLPTTASGTSGIAIGEGAQAIGPVAPHAFGDAAVASGTTAALAIGHAPEASGDRSVAIGQNAIASGDFSFAAGPRLAAALAESSIAIGDSAEATADAPNSVVIGVGADAQQDDQVVIGPFASGGASAPRAVVIGRNASGQDDFVVAIGEFTAVADADGIGIGSSASVEGSGAVGIGANILVRAVDSVGVGKAIDIAADAFQGTALGSSTVIGAGHDTSTALGSGATTTKQNQVMAGTIGEVVTHPGGVEYHVNEQSANYLMDLDAAGNQKDFYIPVDATGGNRTVTLKPATGSGRLLWIKKIDSSGNTVTIEGDGTDTIDGQLNQVLSAQYDSIMIQDRDTGVWDVFCPVCGGGSGSAVSAPIGTIYAWGTNTAPTDHLLLDGSAVSRTTYSELFALWGTTYGTGDGSTTFNLPDARGRFILGKAAAGTGSTLGGTGGTIDHVHNVDPPNTTSSVPSATTNITVAALPPSVGSGVHTHDVNIAPFDSALANPPFIALNWIVKALNADGGLLSVVTKTMAYTVSLSDDVVLGDATGAAFTLTLPTAVGISGQLYYFKKIDASANAVTIDGAGAETIDDATTFVLANQYDAITIVSNGSEWYVI